MRPIYPMPSGSVWSPIVRLPTSEDDRRYRCRPRRCEVDLAITGSGDETCFALVVDGYDERPCYREFRGILLLKLSEKVSEQPSEGRSERYEGPKWGENDLLGGLSGFATSACKAFRTVSLGTTLSIW
jgi:hypothetical protein